MTDRSSNTDNTPLFQNMDEQEAVYAPQQIPGADQTDAGDTNVTTNAGLDTVTIPAVSAGNITGTSAGGVGAGVGAAPIAPVVPVRRGLADDEQDGDRL